MARKPKSGPPIMTNKAALYVLYDLAGGRMKGWKALERDLDANVQDIYKRNRPWPSGFGPKEYCKAFTRYADEGHTSHYAALIAVKRSLEDSNALTPEVKAIIDNVRPDVDERAARASLARVMETIVETALPYNKVGAAVGEEQRGAGGLASSANRAGRLWPASDRYETSRVISPQAGSVEAPGMQPGLQVDDSRCYPVVGREGPVAQACTGQAAELLGRCVQGLDAEGLLVRVVPASLMCMLAPKVDARAACACAGSTRDELAGTLCQDGGLACRKMQRACQELARTGAVDEVAVLACTRVLLDEGSGGPRSAELRRATSLFHRHADGDAGRALFAAILLFLVGPHGFNRVMTCPDTAALFER